MTALVIHQRQTSRHGLAVLVGAVEVDPRTRHLPVRIASSLEEAMVAAREALEAGLLWQGPRGLETTGNPC